jgi:iron complex outermembrane receptor protein
VQPKTITTPEDQGEKIMIKSKGLLPISQMAPALLAMLMLHVGAARAQQAQPAATAADSSGLTEIVVTARRRAENLQDVPLAVTAISADTLQQDNVTSLADLNSFVPNMKISTDRATSSTINVYIRGVGQSDPLWGFEPGVGVYIDDVYMARPQAALLDVYDVDRLEILRGPQGTRQCPSRARLQHHL